jgi:hypothetical protein
MCNTPFAHSIRFNKLGYFAKRVLKAAVRKVINFAKVIRRGSAVLSKMGESPGDAPSSNGPRL